MKFVPILIGAGALSACAIVGPAYAPPEVALAERFAYAASPHLEEAAHDHWWRALGDPTLDDLMRQGLARNLDIRSARARIEESAALLRAEGVAETQLDGNLLARIVRSRSDGTTTGSDRLTLDGSFVFDLFGGAARRRQQARAVFEASVFDAAATRLAYQSELVGAVVEARFFQAATRSTERTIASRRRILGLTRQMLETGQLTRNDQVRARAQLAEAQADLPAFRNGLHLNAVRVATLLDMPVGPIRTALARSGGTQPVPSRSFAAGVPADLLRNRPDVIAAERRLAAAFAAIGVAEARLYPELAVDGTIALGDGEGVTLGPRLSVPVLGRGRLIQLRAATEARADEAELAWRSTLRGAIADVERALVNIDTARAEIDALGRAVREFRALSLLSQETFQIGSSTLLELLDAEQEIQGAELNLARARRDLTLGVARLAVATGRGHMIDGTREAPLVVAAAPKD